MNTSFKEYSTLYLEDNLSNKSLSLKVWYIYERKTVPIYFELSSIEIELAKSFLANESREEDAILIFLFMFSAIYFSASTLKCSIGSS